MNIRSYIESGMLEAYVIGILPEHQMAEVTEIAAKHVEIREELSRIEVALESAAMAQQVPPPLEMEDQIIKASSSGNSWGKHRENNSNKISSTNNCLLWRLISAGLGVILIGLGIFAWGKYKSDQQKTLELDQLKTEQVQYAADYDVINDQLAQIQQDFDITTDNSFTRLVLNGTDNAPGVHSFVYWNPNTADLYLKAGNLKSLATDKQYQLWAIIDGVPVDAGVFDLDSKYLVKMKSTLGSVATFAVTIEPRGGSVSPSLETMQVAGNL